MKSVKNENVRKKEFSYLQQQWLDIHKRNIENGKEMSISIQNKDGSIKRLKWSDIPLGLMEQIIPSDEEILEYTKKVQQLKNG